MLCVVGLNSDYHFGTGNKQEKSLKKVCKAKDVFSAFGTSFIVDENNRLFSCGYNYGQINDKDIQFIIKFTQINLPILGGNYLIAVGSRFFCIYDSGKLNCFGFD
jgi:hypothetical protein